LSWLKNDIDDAAFVQQVGHNFATLVEAWRMRDLPVRKSA
jgi:myo-inositol catabolism protein IolC